LAQEVQERILEASSVPPGWRPIEASASREDPVAGLQHDLAATDDTAVDIPPVRYAKARDGTHIAFQVFGHGSRDLVYVPGFISNLLLNWELPGMAHILHRFARFARVVVIDHRGTGLSDRLPPGQLPPLETQMDDLTAVMEAVNIRKAHLFGEEDGAELCVLFAASYPERVESLSIYALRPRMFRADDFPFGYDEDVGRVRLQARASLWDRGWGLEAAREDYEFAAPSVANDESEVAMWARYLQLSASPGSAVALLQMWADTDVRAVLPTVRVPTLVLARSTTPDDHPAIARWVAERIPGARFAELPGRDLAPWIGDTDAIIDEVEGFITGVKGGTADERMLATVVFTDLVGSTERAATLGDARWKELLGAHHDLVRAELARFRGREIDTTGDGFFALFDGPARAVRFAQAAIDVLRSLDLEIRVGVHTGEVEFTRGKIQGIAVHIGARVAAAAGAHEILVTSTVRDIVAGSGLAFEDHGEHELKGVPEPWRLFRVTA
jgi:class 3 adenylate cyclase